MAKKQKKIILMADIVSSRKVNQALLMKKFKGIISEISKNHRKSFLSPPTITLGDEFQAVVTSIGSCCQLLIDLEELIIEKKVNFKLRYVVYQGYIDTEINKKIAYGMLGEGLTNAREKMNELKRRKARFSFVLDDEVRMKLLNDVYWLIEYQIDGWKFKDYDLISRFIKGQDYKNIAIKMRKDASLIWKRKKSLQMEGYMRLKNLTHHILHYE